MAQNSARITMEIQNIAYYYDLSNEPKKVIVIS